MTGDDLRHVTLETQADMARLLAFDPSISHLTLEIGDDPVHVARDWPSDQYEEADRLIDRIAAAGLSRSSSTMATANLLPTQLPATSLGTPPPPPPPPRPHPRN